jgi:hypothetical protein
MKISGFKNTIGERGSDAFIIIPVNTGLYNILLKTGSPIGSLNLQRIKLLKRKDNE